MTSRALRAVATWATLSALTGAASGALSAFFLRALDGVTAARLAHPWLLYGLPIAGLALGAADDRVGTTVRKGPNLVLDTLHDDGPELPTRLAPMVLVGTLVTHAFGGSAGREGTAVQMGATAGDFIAHRAGLSRQSRRPILLAGIAGGFGSAFGTPLAGVVFAVEFVRVGRLEYTALLPALIAAFVGDAVARALGAVHTAFPRPCMTELTAELGMRWVAFALTVALTSTLFIECTHRFRAALERRVRGSGARMAIGGLAVVVLATALGTQDYLGLGVPMIVRAFEDPSLPAASFLIKIGFTVLTVGSGFVGGEVTPLFFIGAVLGNVLGRALGIPIDLAAGVGLATVFAAASNAPIALSIMAFELFGPSIVPHVVLVAAIAFAASGRRSIYSSQRFAADKDDSRPRSADPGDSRPE